ncbi:MAG: hypothetical protein LUE11_03135 [Clostridia bacterium]|nr:hypothetical protein [Clostridia bacterium]
MSIASLILGLIAWCIPPLLMNKNISSALLAGTSFGCCGLAVILQFIDIKNFALAGDVSAILDTIGMMMFASAVLVIVTVGLNVFALQRRTVRR